MASVDQTLSFGNGNWQNLFLEFLTIDFNRRKNRNARFSLRQYARKLDLSVGDLSEIMRKRRNITFEKAVKTAPKLILQNNEMATLFNALGLPLKTEWLEVARANKNPIKNWTSLLILGLVQAQNGNLTADMIAKEIGRDYATVAEHLKDLLAKSLICIVEEKISLNGKFECIVARASSCSGNQEMFTDSLIRVREAFKNKDAAKKGESFIFLGNAQQAETLRAVIVEIIERTLLANACEGEKSAYQISFQIF